MQWYRVLEQLLMTVCLVYVAMLVYVAVIQSRPHVVLY